MAAVEFNPKALSLKETLEYKAPEVIAQFERAHPELKKDSHLIFNETLKWLWACTHKQGPALIISTEIEVIDLMWHQFILFTKDYSEFCKTYLGQFIHHDPLTTSQLQEFDALRNSDPIAAKKKRQEELKPQLEFLYDLLGAETLTLWYKDFPVRYPTNATQQ